MQFPNRRDGDGGKVWFGHGDAPQRLSTFTQCASWLNGRTGCLRLQFSGQIRYDYAVATMRTQHAARRTSAAALSGT
jgi:hypothetical protein